MFKLLILLFAIKLYALNDINFLIFSFAIKRAMFKSSILSHAKY